MCNRHRFTFFLTSLFGIASSSAVLAADTDLVAAGAKVEQLANGFEFTEGPACDASGNIFFSDKEMFINYEEGTRLERWAEGFDYRPKLVIYDLKVVLALRPQGR